MGTDTIDRDEEIVGAEPVSPDGTQPPQSTEAAEVAEGPKVGDTYLTILTKFAGEGWIDPDGEVWSYRYARIAEVKDGKFRPEMFKVSFEVGDVASIGNGAWVHKCQLENYRKCMAAVKADKRTTGISYLDRALAKDDPTYERPGSQQG